MKEKLTIWFLGSNSVGKTTQCALLHLLLRDVYNQSNYRSRVIQAHENGVTSYYTKVSPVSANLGIFHHPLTAVTDPSVKPNACCGTDKLSTKAQIELAYRAALADPEVTIITVDAIMATGQFLNFLVNENSLLFTILLDCTEEINFKRLAERRAAKRGVEPSQIIIDDRTKENLSSKLRGFRSMYEKAKPKSDFFKVFSTDLMLINEISSCIIDLLTL